MAKKFEKELGITLEAGEKLTADAVEELSNGKGDDE